MRIRTILVTGGAGCFGSHLVDALAAREYRVVVLDNLVPQVHRSGTWPPYANPRAEYVRGDVRDRSVCEPLVLDADAAGLLERLLGSAIELQVTQSGRKFDIRHDTADISRATSTLGFQPSVSLEQGFTELIEWARTPPDVAEDFFDRALDELNEKGLLVR